ncbi:MAG: glyoxalase/bleomycin resistance/dioxygenase family protein [Bradyrhizobium sp.]|nr:glyoxalase/bleomycin resistance/dioxygenase family protein [Bradyrhizobium sp.]
MKIKHAYLTAAKPDELAKFYKDVGLAVRFADGSRWIQFASEAAAFCIADIEESATTPSSNAVVVFEVERLEETVKLAAAAGGNVLSEIRDMGSHGRVARIRDPENNIIQFFEPAPKAGAQLRKPT